MHPSRLAVPLASLARDVPRALSIASELGVGGVEIDGRHGIDLLTLSDTGIRQLKKWLADYGLRVAAVTFLTRGGYAEVDRLEARVAATKQALGQARKLGATVVLGRLGDIPTTEDADDWQILVDVISDIGRAGQQVGAMFCAEAGRASPKDLQRLLAAVPEGTMQVDLVTGALVVYGHDPTTAADGLALDTGYVHATDAMPGAFAGQGRAVPFGTGQVDLPLVLATLEERGYRGWIGLEATTTEPTAVREELIAASARLLW